MEPTEQRETLRDLPAAGGLHGLVAGLAAVNGREGAVVGGAVGEEGGALDLLDVVEAGNADEALGEGAGAGADLGEDLLGVGAAVHGELPHDPVAVVVVAGVHGVVHVGPAVGVGVGLVGGLELNAGSPAVVEEVLDLAGDLLVGEGGEEGESLEEPGEGKRWERGVEVRELSAGSSRGGRALERYPNSSGFKKNPAEKRTSGVLRRCHADAANWARERR